MEELVERARAMLGAQRRTLLGICGAPGAGKSTVARLLADRLGPQVLVVPMDGFHLHDQELTRLDRLDRKGAPDTFDIDGYLTLLGRIRAAADRTIYAPSFDRGLEVSLAGAIPVLPEHRLVITEGNYLLLDAPGWRDVRDLLDECWFVETEDVLRRQRLIDRHKRHGRTSDAAAAWVTRSDEANASLVATTRHVADLVVSLT